MKNRLQKIYLLTTATLTLILIDTPVENKIRQLISDNSRLSFHYENNIQADTTITLINMADYPMDTVRKWTKRILEFGPKVIAVDNFSDTLYNIERVDAKIVLPIISEDGKYFEYSTNNITTNQTHGVALVDDYFRMKNFFLNNSEKLPSFAIQIVKEYNSDKYAEVIKHDEAQLINYLPVNSFRIINFPDIYPNELLEPWIKDKIVIIGYLGYTDSNVPDILDNNDSHVTPIGKIFGPLIIANQIHTLLANQIVELSRLILVSIALTIFLSTYFLITRIKSRRTTLIIVTLNLTLVLLIWLGSFTSMLVLFKYDTFISIELITLSLTLGFQMGIVTLLSEE